MQVERFERDAQTVVVRNKIQQVAMDAATQMVSMKPISLVHLAKCFSSYRTNMAALLIRMVTEFSLSRVCTRQGMNTMREYLARYD